MATASAAARESRRRKLVDRGADRLALITGRIESLPPDSSNNPIADSSQPTISPDPPTHLADQTTVPSSIKDEDSSSVLPNLAAAAAAADTDDGGSGVEFPLRDIGISINALRVSDLDVGDNAPSALTSSRDEDLSMPTSSTVSNFRPATHQNRFLTPKQISSAITASEISRALCSLIVATFVVLSYLGFPILGSNIIKGILSLRPLYLVLLTSLTLVVGWLLLKNERGRERVVKAEKDVPSAGRFDWAEQAGKTLEVGLLMQKAIDAVFMDCSIYAVILICGLSLVKQLSI